MIQTFQKRLVPKRYFGFPAPCVFTVLGGGVCLAFSYLLPVVVFKVPLLLGGIGLLFSGYSDYVNYNDWNLLSSLRNGKEMEKLKTFGRSGKKIFSDVFCWKTNVGNTLAHYDNAVSLAFEWRGVNNQFFDDDEFNREHEQRIALLKMYKQQQGICIENHFIRDHDDSLCDAYLTVQKHINPNPPKIISNIINDLVDLYRPLGRSNKVMTVISYGPPVRLGFWETIRDIFFGLLSPKLKNRIHNWQELEKKVMEIFSELKPEFDGARLLSYEEYAKKIIQIRQPECDTPALDWRYELSDQLTTGMPVKIIEDECLKLDDTFYKVCLLENYPNNLAEPWFFMMSQTPDVGIHISQIIMPVDVDSAVDAAAKEDTHQKQTISEQKGMHKTVGRIKDSEQYQQYVTQHNLPIADNAYIVTFYSKDKETVLKYARKFTTQITRKDGKVRTDLDMQMDMFNTRLPGMGRYTYFKRQDHGDVIAAMKPYTTFSNGNNNPESLRIAANGQLIGYSPSGLSVPHELVVAETDGGKDTQYGLKFVETYAKIQYDIVEFGNSYQGPVEAVGGRYCQASEQVINPMIPYSELEEAKNISTKDSSVEDIMLSTLSDSLMPIFKGFGGMDDKSVGFSMSEDVVMGRALQHCYTEVNEGSEAPILQDLSDAFLVIETRSDEQREATRKLKSCLDEFLQTPYGKKFKDQNQFEISTIANAIDFNGLKGKMFDFFFNFTISRLASRAMSRGKRSQIVLNEYKFLFESSPKAVKHITWMIDRMGRKDWVGLTRISQGLQEILDADPEANNSISNLTLLSRKDKHESIGVSLKIPYSAVSRWVDFVSPSRSQNKNIAYREGLVCEAGEWNTLILKFPELLLEFMNTRGQDKQLRRQAFAKTKDPIERINILRQLIKERDKNEIIKKDITTADNNNSEPELT